MFGLGEDATLFGIHVDGEAEGKLVDAYVHWLDGPDSFLCFYGAPQTIMPLPLRIVPYIPLARAAPPPRSTLPKGFSEVAYRLFLCHAWQHFPRIFFLHADRECANLRVE